MEATAVGNAALKQNWVLVKDWTVESRYVTTGLDGEVMYRAATGRNGVLAWLRQHW
ncbi:MAG: hypothetical protein ABSB14_15420 [Candidatus Sulfotelmatobacter sp.]